MLRPHLALVALLSAPAEASAQDAARHWAFVPPVAAPLPACQDAQWPRNAVDRFVLARLERDGLRPATEAERLTLLRRVHLDLTGIPPAPAEQDAFVADLRPDAYERVVDALLASPHYGEQQARRWLDLARYADTNGYEKDRTRSIWPWRDWVIQSRNDDQPFDQFTREQLAGDLLPAATAGQRIATGFLRNSMLNEEGGIDVEEFRHAAVVDRVNTVATTWLGLTLRCAQCHDHKYDPLTQRDYYGMLAFLNQCDEPSMAVPDPRVTAARTQALARIAQEQAELPERFPLPASEFDWQVLAVTQATARHGVTLATLPDGSLRASGPRGDSNVYTVVVDTQATGVCAFRLEALGEATLPSGGPGRADNGNFVVSEFAVTATRRGDPGPGVPVAWRCAQADFEQDGFPARGAIDGDLDTGWAVDAPGRTPATRDHQAVFETRAPIGHADGTRLTFVLTQRFRSHPLGRFRLLAGTPRGGAARLAERRQERLRQRFAEWCDTARAQASDWTTLRPERVAAENGTTLVVQPDASVLAQGDMPQTDVYEIDATVPHAAAALRLDALTHHSLTDQGPGRAPIYSPGDFLLSEIELRILAPGSDAPGERIAIRTASHSYAHPDRPASKCFDGSLETGWSIQGRAGEDHHAVFVLEQPIPAGARLRVTLRQHGIHQMTLGHFQLSTTDAPNARASGLPLAAEALLRSPAVQDPPAADAPLRALFLAAAPELAGERAHLVRLRQQLPRLATTLVVQERAPEYQRTTWLRKRGEFTRRMGAVEPTTPAALHPFPADLPRNRLGLARWLTSPDNPLVARVAVNRLWSELFGRGLVATVDDFGTRGERPSHPELLDWLALEFVRLGWSQKQLLRLLVTSATYRQAETCSTELRARDPHNDLLARAPRLRVTAETVRDLALSAAGLLDGRIGGPSIFPPQPPGFTTLGYGAAEWQTSTGPDRYRRGLYVFQKRTTPYALFQTFDAPSGEVSCPIRPRTDTPLQALALLNDEVFLDAARGLAARVLREAPAAPEARLRHAYRCTLARPPRPEEQAEVLGFLTQVRGRLDRGELDAAVLTGQPAGDPAALRELAAWTAVARVLLNLDETVTRS